MDVLIETGRPAVWVGMPPMRDANLDAGIQEANAVMRSEAKRRPLVTYVDAHSLFGGPGYTSSITVDGEPTTVRLDDGIHLNVAGSYVAADEILRTVDNILAEEMRWSG
jgi:hypothetical protein